MGLLLVGQANKEQLLVVGNMTLTPNPTLLAAKMVHVLLGTSQTKQLETRGF